MTERRREFDLLVERVREYSDVQSERVQEGHVLLDPNPAALFHVKLDEKEYVVSIVPTDLRDINV